MKHEHYLTVVRLLVLIPLIYSQYTQSCPVDRPDRPALTGHIEQANIESGSLTLEAVIQHRRSLFVTMFNRCDGQGRSATP